MRKKREEKGVLFSFSSSLPLLLLPLFTSLLLHHLDSPCPFMLGSGTAKGALRYPPHSRKHFCSLERKALPKEAGPKKVQERKEKELEGREREPHKLLEIRILSIKIRGRQELRSDHSRRRAAQGPPTGKPPPLPGSGEHAGHPKEQRGSSFRLLKSRLLIWLLVAFLAYVLWERLSTSVAAPRKGIPGPARTQALRPRSGVSPPATPERGGRRYPAGGRGAAGTPAQAIVQ